MKYKKVLVARHSPKNQCFAEDGDWLFVALDGHTIKGGLPEDHHFFISIETGQPSRYGWVAELSTELTAEEYAIKIDPNPTETLIEFSRRLLEAASKYEIGTPMACTWSTVGIMDKKRVMKVHKVFFHR